MPTDQRGRAGGALLALVVGAGAVALGVVLVREGFGPLPDPERCVAVAGGAEVGLSIEQAENAAVIAGIGVRRGLPARAVSIALATAYQESKIVNVDYGDRDSLGLFQQRPSQGWGTAEEVQDPVHATNRFYDALVEVEGYAAMPITQAAQRVQRSGFPDAYEDHAADARVLASALTGYSQAAFTCVTRSPGTAAETLTASGLTPRAERVRADLERVFGEQSLGGFAPGGVRDGHAPGSAHYDGRAVDVFFRPVTEDSRRRGWAVAHYLVAHAERLAVDHVIFDARIWSTGLRSAQGWRDYEVDRDRPGDRDVLLHRDHVHVDVVAGG